MLGSIPIRGIFLFCSSPSMLAGFCRKRGIVEKPRICDNICGKKIAASGVRDQDVITQEHVSVTCQILEFLEFTWVFHDRSFCQIIWQIFTQGRAKKKFIKNCPQWGLKPGPLDLQANALPTELSQHSVGSLNLHSLYKVMLYWF